MNSKLENSIMNIKKELVALEVEEETINWINKIITGILSSSRGRLYVKRNDDYEEYLTFRNKAENLEEYQFCVIERMIDYAGATAGRRYNYLDLPSLIAYTEKNKEALNTELNNVKYYQMYHSSKETPDSEKTEKQYAIERIKEKIEALPVPSYKKQRTIAVLEKIAVEELPRFCTAQTQTTDEYLSIENGSVKLTIKLVDYAGATIDRRTVPLNSINLVDYIDKNKEYIDGKLLSQNRIKR